jgi:hypothetical protein
MATAELVKVGIVNARGTDGYSLVSEYSDGSQSSPWGWFNSIDAAERAAGEDVVVEDWTSEDE